MNAETPDTTYDARGFTWKPVPGISPTILAAMAEVGSRPVGVSRYCHGNWVLDYSFTPGTRFRVGSAKARWCYREASEAHLYPPGCPYWEKIDRKSFLRTAYMIFSAGEEAGLGGLVAGRNAYACIRDETGVLGSLLEDAAHEACGQGENGYWETQSVFCRALGHLQRVVPEGSSGFRLPDMQNDRESAGLVERVDALMRQRMTEPIRLADLAAAAGMTVSSFCRHYKQESGEAPMKRLLRLRISTAQGLLLKGMNLGDIAERMGFCDAYHFSKTFKRFEGVSPSAYRRAIRQSRHR